jgi:CheY-like chemotaxis protein
MKKILLVGDKAFFNDHISFLLKVSGFELVQVRNLEEAINMIEINRSLLLDFDLLILEESEMNDGTCEYFRFLKNMLGRIKLLLLGYENPDLEIAQVLRAENVCHCSMENLVVMAKGLVQEEILDDWGRDLDCPPQY